MALIALNDAKINQSTSSGHIKTERYIQTGTGGGYCNARDEDGNCTSYAPTYPIFNWVGGYSTSAKIDGTCTASSTQVFIQGKNPVLKGDKTKESDTYQLGSSERYASGQHTNVTTGSVTGGNSNNVYVGGKLIAIAGSTITTHAGTSTTIGSTGLSSTVYIG